MRHEATVELYHWNPRRPIFESRLGRRIPLRRPVNNFGDLLGPLLVRELLRRASLEPSHARRPARLLSVGSVLRAARDGDVVWGAGVNGKSLQQQYDFKHLDVRAVRGPLTRQFLVDRGIDVPFVYGDPGLLIGKFFPLENLRAAGQPRSLTVIPNLNDLGDYKASPEVVDPRSSLKRVIRAIAQSEFVVGSSLHAIVLAESFGIPARLVQSGAEPDFKYSDYYLGTGRPGFCAARTVSQAVDMGGEPSPKWDAQPLLDAFPYDLWA